MKITRMVRGTTIEQPRFRALFAFVLARPLEVIAGRQVHFLVDLLHGVLDGAPQIAAANVEGDGIIAGVAFAVDVVGAVLDLHSGQLRQRDALAGGGEQADIGDRLRRVAIGRLVAHHHVVALLAEQHLADGVAPDGGLDGVLDVGHVDPEAGRLLRSTTKLRFGWPSV